MIPCGACSWRGHHPPTECDCAARDARLSPDLDADDDAAEQAWHEHCAAEEERALAGLREQLGQHTLQHLTPRVR